MAGYWAEMTAKITAEHNSPEIVRLVLPAGYRAIDIDWIELDRMGSFRHWGF